MILQLALKVPIYNKCVLIVYKHVVNFSGFFPPEIRNFCAPFQNDFLMSVDWSIVCQLSSQMLHPYGDFIIFG